ncbi:MAG: tetratricopeptide repeat protein, partial [bacterium]
AAFLPMAGIGLARLVHAARGDGGRPEGRPYARTTVSVAIPILLAGAITASVPVPVVSWRALYNAGNAYLASGRDADASRLFGRCADAAPAFPEAHFYRGLALAHQKDYAGAAEAYGRALSLRPRWARAWNSLGVARGASGDERGARDAFRRTLVVEPSNAEAGWNLRMLDRGGRRK